ncbi:hypothetical protein [Neorhizobium galegae]|uniref:hypothetical protein n=1 Tax=Neorhizobium galegae TaxID=399 RepID=UPI002103D03C|nr:hypothetical protein [Neorhizobium galegae]MCQ1833511.1 hypothetical protein [Neorhizobium galegae]UIY30639.1 hypothetical protein LZK73_09080 [Neorhizobium galegae]
MNIRKEWDTWGWLIALVLIVLVFARLMFGREPFCGVDEGEHCLREWVSALGAWAAVPAAVVTVIFLSRQVQEAARHHRQTVAVQLDQKYEMVKGAKVVVEWAIRDVQAWIEGVGSAEDNLKAEIEFARKCLQIYSNQVLDEFENAFYIETPTTLCLIRETLKQKVDAADGLSTLRNIVLRTQALQLDILQDFNRAFLSAAQRFLDRYDSLTNG